MTDEDEPILKTVQEVKMAKNLLLAVNTKRLINGQEMCWLLQNEAVNVLGGFNANSVYSFLDKLRDKGIIEDMLVFRTEWGGVFRFTKEGDEQLNAELNDLSKLLSLTCFQDIIDAHRSKRQLGLT